MTTTSRFNVVQAVVAGLCVGLLIALAPSCGTKMPPAQRCSADNCSGCCDSSDNCFNGDGGEACGFGGTTCQTCDSTQVCGMGQCVIAMNDGGTGGGAGGGTGTGGGAGGSNDGGHTDGGCSAANCGNGCCTAQGVCTPLAQENFSKCGMGGAMCTGCASGKACQAGVCQVPECSACIDGAGNCRTDKMTLTDDNYCGFDGGFCHPCDTANGAHCMNGACTGTSTGCNATNCDGCCSGNTCIGASDGGLSDAQCGLGAASCVTCSNATCDKDAGVCTGSTNPNDGGLPGTCDPTTCLTGCCDIVAGCVADGTTSFIGIGVDCSNPANGPGNVCDTCFTSCAEEAAGSCISF